MERINEKIIEILNNRGIVDEKEIEEFLSLKPQKTYDPFLLLNMDVGVDLILSAIDKNEKICIYGDYDADGVTSVTLLMDVIGSLTDNVYYYIPSRIEEGYGLNNDAIESIYRDGTKLIVTVDCGSTSVRQVAYCRGLGMNIVVTDHHQVSAEKPPCPIINPSQKECQYPFKYLAGVGVAFKLAQALVEVTGLPKSILARNLDVVALGTIGDVVPLVDENRTITKYGMRALHMTNKIGLKHLIEATVKNPSDISSKDISFGIVPHINSAGRISEASSAVKLLMSQDENDARSRVESIVELNKQRKDMQHQLIDIGKAMVETEFSETNKTPEEIKIITLVFEEAHEGVTGIVAGHLKEKYNVPVVIMTNIGDGMYKGTGRSTESIDLYQLLKSSEDLFTKFGGHKAACGFSIAEENVSKLKSNLSNKLDEMLAENPRLLEHKIDYDVVLEDEYVSLDFVDELRLLEPFGRANKEPVMKIDGQVINVMRFGKEQQFVGANLSLQTGSQVRCISFKNGDNFEKQLKKGPSVSIIGTLKINEYNNNKSLNIEMLDVIPGSF